MGKILPKQGDASADHILLGPPDKVDDEDAHVASRMIDFRESETAKHVDKPLRHRDGVVPLSFSSPDPSRSAASCSRSICLPFPG